MPKLSKSKDKGWFFEPERHSLAAKGVKTGRKNVNPVGRIVRKKQERILEKQQGLQKEEKEIQEKEEKIEEEQEKLLEEQEKLLEKQEEED